MSEPVTLYDLLAAQAASNGERVAVEQGDTVLTYGELHQEAERVASWLEDAGVTPGDRVCVHLYKSVEEVIASFAVVRSGAVLVNINYQWTTHQLLHVLEDAGVRILIADARRAGQLAGSCLPASLEKILVKGEAPNDAGMTSWSTIDRYARPNKPPLDLDSNSLALILYTSGSTGAPKGVMLSHRNLLLGARSVCQYLGLRREDIILSHLPFSFDYGFNQLLDACLLGARVVLQPVTMPSVLVQTLLEKNVTVFAAVPPTWIQLVRHVDKLTSLPKLKSLRIITNSGGKIPSVILELLPKVFPGVDIFLMYGLTEAFRSTYLPPKLFSSKKGAIGRAIPFAETYVIKEDRVCRPGEQGELVHRGELISLGYWNKPEATAEKIKSCPQLWHLIGDEKVVYSGDIVRIDEDGDYWFVGRSDSMIKASGFRISPTEVEEIVYKSKLVAEVVAFGVDHEWMGQAVHIAVSALPNQKVDADAVYTYCRANMPHYMQPLGIHEWFGPMPRTANGKIDASSVVRRFTARLPGEPAA